VSGLKTPGPALPQSPEEMEEFLLDKSQRIFSILNFIEIIFKSFIKARISSRWSSKTMPSIKKWINLHN
jgi:hypothetical protein